MIVTAGVKHVPMPDAWRKYLPKPIADRTIILTDTRQLANPEKDRDSDDRHCIGHRCTVISSDIKNAYFQAMPIDCIVIMRQPQGGLLGVDAEAFLLIRVPVYGLCGSGRGFWKKVDHDAKEVGLLSSRIFPAFYFHIENGAVDVVLTTHVDDFLRACTESGHAVVDRLLTRFEVGRKEEGRLRFCGKQFDASGHDILLDVEDNTRKTTYVEIAKHRNPADPVTKGEEKQLRIVVGSLSWIARQARPDILYRVSKLQSSIKGPTVSTLKEANKVLELALNGMDLKLRYKNGPFNFQELGVLTASDASFAGEPGSRSQQGRIHFLVPAQQLLDPECCDYDVMIVTFSSTNYNQEGMHGNSPSTDVCFAERPRSGGDRV